MSETEEIAKAVQSVANLGEASLEVITSFFAVLFKEPAQEVSGMITDKLRFIRWQLLFQIVDKANRFLEERGVTETRFVAPKLALPIFEEGSLEEDPSLQVLWSHLLANAMDPEFNGELRYGFIDMIKNITGIEALILDVFYDALKRDGHTNDLTHITDFGLKKEQIMEVAGIDEASYYVSIYNLMRMQCIGPLVIKAGLMTVGGESPTIYKGAEVVVLTPLGVKFVEACIK